LNSNKDFDVTAVVLASVPFNIYEANRNLQRFLHDPSFLMMPIASSLFIKISGSASDVTAGWRHNQDKDIIKITRTLDAFAHFVFVRSQGTMLMVCKVSSMCWTFELRLTFFTGYFAQLKLEDANQTEVKGFVLCDPEIHM
jgi:hypothetical protein